MTPKADLARALAEPLTPVRPGPVRVRADVQFLRNAWAFAWRFGLWVAFGLGLSQMLPWR